ncbi:hypothetical protein [Candidatus Berkiella aquae]|uniref:Uncharacterized protein n=1 Tax=Candidatus Berkiella aquae TaxID=295108 RepID=A0A0Q9YML8_9GAMM|nr:hypothetical protein [Candidatus Berkiella aquae]MCS5710305.1 hypothetical protein [Candidatus Berkiella aquae]
MKNVLTLGMIFISFGLCAQPEQLLEAMEPDDPNACVSHIHYISPFHDYEPQGPMKLESWRKANETVMNQRMQPMKPAHKGNH